MPVSKRSSHQPPVEEKTQRGLANAVLVCVFIALVAVAVALIAKIKSVPTASLGGSELAAPITVGSSDGGIKKNIETPKPLAPPVRVADREVEKDVQAAKKTQLSAQEESDAWFAESFRGFNRIPGQSFGFYSGRLTFITKSSGLVLFSNAETGQLRAVVSAKTLGDGGKDAYSLAPIFIQSSGRLSTISSIYEGVSGDSVSLCNGVSADNSGSEYCAIWVGGAIHRQHSAFIDSFVVSVLESSTNIEHLIDVVVLPHDMFAGLFGM